MSETAMEQDRPFERAHRFAQWLSDRLPLYVPEASTERRVRRWNQWADRQMVRRAVVVMGVFVLAVMFACWTGEAYIDHVRHLDGHGLFHRIVAFMTAASWSFQVGAILFWINVVYMLAGSSTENLAMLEYGVPYDELTMSERRTMLVRQRAKMFVMCFRGDERQSLQLQRAERAAYRILRRTVVAVVIAIWAAYLIAPETVFRRLLQGGGLMMNNPLMLTWLAMVLVALPRLIRLWMEPDAAGEPLVVTMKREA